MIKKYRKKDVIYEAVQFRIGDMDSITECLNFFPSCYLSGLDELYYYGYYEDSAVTCWIPDKAYIVKISDSEFKIYSEDEFKQQFEEIY